MERLPPELLTQLPPLTEVFYADDPLLYAKLSAPGEPWHFYLFAIEGDGPRLAGFVDTALKSFSEVQFCRLHDLNELSRKWAWDPSGADVIRDVAFRPCRHSEVKRIWGRV